MGLPAGQIQAQSQDGVCMSLSPPGGDCPVSEVPSGREGEIDLFLAVGVCFSLFPASTNYRSFSSSPRVRRPDQTRVDFDRGEIGQRKGGGRRVGRTFASLTV